MFIHKENESKVDFINRCMTDRYIISEHPNNEDRYNYCLLKWDTVKPINFNAMEEQAKTKNKAVTNQEIILK